LKRREGVPDYALADFIAPKNSGKQDYIGCFCVSTGFGLSLIVDGILDLSPIIACYFYDN